MTETVLPGFLDAHVHLALVDPEALPGGGIARVLDLGGWPRRMDAAPSALGAASEPSAPHSSSAPFPVESDLRNGNCRPERSLSQAGSAAGPGAGADVAAGLEVAYAGQFLTAPGGYPGQQPWAPAGSVREVATVADAVAAVDLLSRAGASVIKVTLNSEAGPVLPADVLQAIVTRAHELTTPVVAHAEGVGQALRAFIAGADVLAHTPFSERLVDELIDAMAGRMTWISTLDIHGWGEHNDDFMRASDNLRRFHAHGGRVLYGTDLGNGPLPVGLNRREIDALLAVGMSPDEVLGALTAKAPSRPGGVGITSNTGGAGSAGSSGTPSSASASAPGPSRVTLIPGEAPSDPAGFANWLCTARAVPRMDIKERV